MSREAGPSGEELLLTLIDSLICPVRVRIFERGPDCGCSRGRALGYKHGCPRFRSTLPNRSLLGSGIRLDLKVELFGRCFLPAPCQHVVSPKSPKEPRRRACPLHVKSEVGIPSRLGIKRLLSLGKRPKFIVRNFVHKGGEILFTHVLRG